MRYRQTASENLDDFITRARKLAKKCQFSEDELNERLMELVIASTPHDGFCKDLLTKPVGYKISELLVDGRKFEAISAGKQQLKEMSEHNVSAIRVDCSRYGLKHAPRSCPAYHNTCEKCGKTGHLGKLCRSSSGLTSGKTPGYKNNNSNKNSQHNSPQNAPVKQKNNNRRRRKKFHAVSDNVSVSEDEYVLQYDAITVSDKCFDAIHQQRNEAFTNLRIDLPGVHDGKHSLKLKIDTGASGNTLPIRTLRQMYPQKIPKLQPNNVTLTAYNGENIKCSGKFTLNVYHEKKKHPVLFYVVDVTGPAVIGLPTCEQLNIVTINVDQISPSVPTISSIDDLTHQYPKQFDTIGNFKGTAKLKLKDDAIPFIDAPRKCPIHIKDELKAELDKMERQEVIRKVDEHTDWVSSLAYTTKRDGSLRICLDPQKLNNALRRCPHKIPTLEELNPMFTNAKIFTKLDAKAGYWAVKLDESSQLLTTFRTPFGRYCWRRLPFGLNNSQDIFQARMDSILEGLKGVVSIADDVCVFGATEKEHDVNLINLMERAKREGLVFNSTKCHIKKSEISFFGNTYTKDGIKPDINKIRDLKDMPKPQSKEELMRFLGVITYLSQFIPGLADRAHSLRGLLKKTSDFIWETDHQQEFEQLKNSVTSETCLQYYDRSAPVTLEVDASQKGLGAALLQNEKPVAFGSKTLTDCQSRYSNIEREMLALVFGIQRYHTYLYARPFVIITDHQPLVNITAKPIHSAPPRLQRMLMQIQGYNFTVRYRPGKQMILADALSRSPNAENNSPIQLDLRVDGLDMQLEDHTLKTIALINFSESKQKQLQTETSNDPILRELMDTIMVGWPEGIKKLPADLRAYWSFRHELAIEAGVVFKGRQILIPQTMQNDILHQLHQGHQGIVKTQQLARDSVYWPKINEQIENQCKKCDACQLHQQPNVKQPLIPHSMPDYPWQSIATDLFEIDGQAFLLTVDRYSKYPLVDHMPTPVSSQAITVKIKAYCAQFGRPDVIISDNGPQYTGEAFKRFTREWNINHTTSSPRYPQSNGFIERQVKYLKPLIRKAMKCKEDIQLALLNVRATLLDANMPSPAELMFGRAITKLIPHRSEPGPVAQRDWLHNKQQQIKSYYDKSARKTDLAPMYVGQEVRILDKVSKTWCPGTITRKCAEPRSYMVQTPNGNELRRNRSHLREMSANATPRRLQFADNNTPAAQHTAPSSYHETQTLHPPNTPACSPNEHIEKPTVQNPELPRASPPQVPLCSGQYRTRSGRVSKPTPRYNSEN